MRGRQVLLLAMIPYAVWLVFAYRYHFIDGVNLLFHEAGHLFFGILGRTMHVLGGTLGQLVFPIVLAVYFRREGKAFDSAVCLFWLGESLMYAGVYIGDGRRRALPLINDGIHDWFWLLAKADLLPYAETLGAIVHGIASVVVAAALVLAAQALRADAAEPVEAGGGL
jgi:hypothetical protein